MKILIVNAVYKIKSTGRTYFELSEYARNNGHECLVVYGNSFGNYENSYFMGGNLDHKLHALKSRITGKIGCFSLCATNKLIKLIKEYKPDVVHLGNLHGNYVHIPKLLSYLAKNNIPTSITLHDCFFFTGYCTHYTLNRCYKWQEQCKNCKYKEKYMSWFLDRSKYLFNYTYQNSYKRPFKFTVLAALGRGTSLKNGDIILNHSEYHYNALQHTVSKRVVVPSGPQGDVEVAIPQKIKTHEELSEYLDNYSLWEKDNQDQTDDAYICLSELSKCNNSSNLYKYRDWFVVLTADNKLSTAITNGGGYEPILLYREYLINECGFTLENEYGLTNMIGVYSYNGNFFVLEYDVDCDAIFFSVDIKDEKIPKCFFETISYLEKLDAEKYKS